MAGPVLATARNVTVTVCSQLSSQAANWSCCNSHKKLIGTPLTVHVGEQGRHLFLNTSGQTLELASGRVWVAEAAWGGGLGSKEHCFKKNKKSWWQ